MKIYFINTDLLSCQRFFPRSRSHPPRLWSTWGLSSPSLSTSAGPPPTSGTSAWPLQVASPALLPADTTATRPPVRPYQGCTTKTRAKAQPLQKHNQPVQKPKTSAKVQPKLVQKHNHKFCESPNKQPNNHLTDKYYNPSGLKMQPTFWNNKKMCFKRGYLLVAFAKRLLKLVTKYVEFVWFSFAVNLVGSSEDKLNFKFKG